MTDPTLLSIIVWAVAMPTIWAIPPLVRWCRWRFRPASGGEASVQSTDNRTSLAEAERARTALQSRVSKSIKQASWMAWWCAALPWLLVMLAVYGKVRALRDLPTSKGSWVWFFAFTWIAFGCFALGVSPADAEDVQHLARIHFGFWLFLGAFNLFSAVTRFQVNNTVYATTASMFATMYLASCVALWQTFDSKLCRPSGPMPPRRRLRKVWQIYRLLALGGGLTFIPYFSAPWFGYPVLAGAPQYGWLLSAAVYLACAALFTPSNRGRCLAWLNTLGRTDSAELEAACVASLLGNTSAIDALTAASERFRAMPLKSLTRAHMRNSTPDPSLHALTVAARLGAVHAFASHSWSDDGDTKLDRMHRWAWTQDAGEAGVLLWLDKACIDQDNIDASLQGLPVFLSGCKQLLVLAGPTYHSRLWCVMELFTFVRMGGREENIVVELLSDDGGLRGSLAGLDASKAKCYLDRDQQKLLAVIEASFGTVAPFNKLVRDILVRKVGSLEKAAASKLPASTEWAVAVETV